jgi:hypothetical protein
VLGGSRARGIARSRSDYDLGLYYELINEKGAIAEAATFPETIGELADTSTEIWAAIGARKFPSALQRLRRMASDLDGLVAKTHFR